ncbi:hypothetical protein GCM10025864_04550 [Luteimicrobium album]|uniref:ROK family protein n=1 Tax=Luteimicrobium album TaxID=1054550 RepID=A0ABQ6HXF5_9MICO|nr:hypothetical protein GCM10025864_04550 [Luteimicrobium album]
MSLTAPLSASPVTCQNLAPVDGVQVLTTRPRGAYRARMPEPRTPDPGQTTRRPPAPDDAGTITLSVDCGGSGIKAAVLDAAGTAHAEPVRVPTPYPLPPSRLVETIAEIAATLPPPSA